MQQGEKPMEPLQDSLKELTNVTFDEIQVGTSGGDRHDFATPDRCGRHRVG